MVDTAKWHDRLPTSADLLGSGIAMVQALPMAMALGILVFAPLGNSAALGMGVQAGLVALVVGGLVTLLGGAPGSVSSPRAAAVVVLSGMVAFLARTQPDISTQAVALAVALCLVLSGLVQMVMAAARIDRLLERMPEPVLDGFTLVIGMMIVLDQLNPMLLGQYAPRPDLFGVPALLSRSEGATAWLGLGVLGLVVGLGLLPRCWNAEDVPVWSARLARMAPLLGLLTGLLVVWMLTAPQGTVVDTLGQVLPNFNPADRSWWPLFMAQPGWGSAWQELLSLNSVGWLLGPAALIAVIHSLEALSTARMLGKTYQARRELLAQGLANAVCGLSGGIGVTATPSLSKAIAAAGAAGRWARALLVAWVVLCVLVFWNAVVWLPIPVLGALVAATGVAMFIGNLSPLRIDLSATSLARLDQHLGASVVWLMLLLAMFTPLSPLWVVGLGTALTVLIWVYQSSGKLVFRQYSGLQRRSLEHRSPANVERLRALGHQVQVLEIEGDLFFGTAPLLREHLLGVYSETPEGAVAQRHLVLDFSRLDQMDSSGRSCLRTMLKTLTESAQVKVWLSYVLQHPSLAHQLKHPDVTDQVPEDRWFYDTESALEAIEDELLHHHSHEHEVAVHPRSFMGSALSDADWTTFNQACQPVLLPQEAVLYRSGEPAQQVYWLQEGDMHLMLPPLTAEQVQGSVRGRPDRRSERSKRLAALNPGTWLGLDALIPGAQRTASAKAKRPSRLLALDMKDLHDWAHTHPALAAVLFGSLALEATERLVGAASELVVVDA